MLSVIMLSAIMLSAIMLSVIMLSVVRPGVVARLWGVFSQNFHNYDHMNIQPDAHILKCFFPKISYEKLEVYIGSLTTG
jgi:hypothetical protein